MFLHLNVHITNEKSTVGHDNQSKIQYKFTFLAS